MKFPKFKIGDICTIVRGTYPTMKTPPGPYPLVVTADFRRSADSYQLEGPAVCVPLISSTGHGDAALHRVHYQEGKFALANLLVALLPKDPNLFDAKYLYHLLMVRKDEYFVPLMLGTANVSLKEKDIAGVEIPLPPLSEQRRIVAKIEELAAKIEEARRLRQQAAIQVEAIVPSFSKNLFDPLRCERRPLKEVAEKKTGVAYKADDFIDSGNVPVVRLKEIITKTPVVYLRNPEAYVNVWLEPGDIVLAKTSFSTGSMCLWTGPRAVLNQNAVMLRVREGVEQKYLFIWLAQQVTRHMNDQLADPNFYPYIREADLMQWLVPVPSIPIQRQFVAYFDRVVERVELLKQIQAKTATELDALLPSILDKAFKGEL